MRWVYKIRVSMLKKGEDVEQEIIAAVRDFAGVDPRVEQVEESENKLVVAEIIKESQQNDAIKRLVSGLGVQAATVAEQVASRVHEEDGDWVCYLRLDKKAFMADRKMVLTDGGNCMHVRLTLAVFPKKQEVAFDLVRKLFASVVKKSI